MILPANCYALSEDEMVYLEGGSFSFDVGSHTVTVNPEAIPRYMINFAVNAAYVLGMGMTSAAIAGVVKGYKDGLSIDQTFDHFFGNMNSAGKVAVIAVGIPLSSYYIYAQAIQIYHTVVTFVDAFKQWRASRNAASTETELAVAA